MEFCRLKFTIYGFGERVHLTGLDVSEVAAIVGSEFSCKAKIATVDFRGVFFQSTDYIFSRRLLQLRPSENSGTFSNN